MSDKPICVHGYSDGHFFDQPDEQEQPSWCVGPITAEMSDRTREAIKQLELRGARVATQAAKDGIGTDLVKVLDAARRFANLTSPETIEKAAKALFRAGFPMENNQYPRKAAEAVLRSVEEGEK